MKNFRQLLLFFVVICFSLGRIDASEDINPDFESADFTEAQDALRGMLNVPSSISPTADSLTTEIVTQAYLGNSTKNFCRAKTYKLLKSVYYSPSVNGGTAIRMSGSGAIFDMTHAAFNFCRSTTSPCGTHAVAIEIGYAPNDIGSENQPDSIVIENGIISNWDLGVVIHNGVRNVTIRNMIFTHNVMPIAIMGRNDVDGNLDTEVCNIHLENVTILGSEKPRKTCLQWIRSKLSDGTNLGISGGPTASTAPYGYSYGEVFPNSDDAIADRYQEAEVYTGIYAYGSSDLNLKNVHISKIGYDENIGTGVPAIVSERTSAYGMWFRNSSSIFMEDVSSINNISSNSVVGIMFDQTSVVSMSKGNFSNNKIKQQQVAGAGTTVPEGLWAAGVVWRDSTIGEFEDVILSQNFGVKNVWGFRVIHSAIYDKKVSTIRPTVDIYSELTESLGFEHIWVDGLRADNVYGFDFGDIYRKLVTCFSLPSVTFLPAALVEKLRMRNIYIRSAGGKVVNNVKEEKIANEFKGIFLGDGSRGVTIDDAYIESNNVVLGASATGRNSGIEFGAESTSYKFSAATGSGKDLQDVSAKALPATGQASGVISDLHIGDTRITSNSGGDGINRFVGIRAVATGVNSIYSAGINEFSNISIENSQINENEFDGFRAVDSISPVTVSGLSLNGTSFGGSSSGYGVNFQTLKSSKFSSSSFSNNVGKGFFADNVENLQVINSSFTDMSAPSGTAVYGFDVSTLASGLTFDDSRFVGNKAVDADATGLHIEAGQTILLKNVKANNNESLADSGVGPFITRGIHFETTVDNLGLYNIQANNNSASNGNVYGIEVEHATSLYADTVQANNNQAEGSQATNNNVSTAMGMFFKSIGSAISEGCHLSNIQAAGNSNAHIAYGIYMMYPIGLTIDGIDGSSNVSDATGLIDGRPVLNQAVGIKFKGGNAVHISGLMASANYETELTAANLSQSLMLGASSVDSEARINITANVAHHFPVLNLSGAYGMYIDGTSNVSIEGGTACKNEGVRAFGVYGRNAENFSAKYLETMENKGVGHAWWNNTAPFKLASDHVTDAIATAVEIPDAQAATQFGDADHASKVVNLKKSYEELLKSIGKQAVAAEAGEEVCDPCTASGSTITSPVKSIASYYNLIWATIAQYRRFCTGAGIGLYSSGFALIDNCRSIGNKSLYDSAGGFVIYGPSEGSVVSNSIAANNECYAVSERGGEGSFNIDGDVDLSEWQILYNWIGVGLLNSETIATPDTYGFIVFPHLISKEAHIDQPPTPDGSVRKPTSLIQPEGSTSDNWTINGRKVTVGFPSGTVPTFSDEAISLYDFVAIAPIGVGILKEAHRDGHVSENNAYGNKGHAGLGVGILADAASSTMFLDNKVTNNSADVIGFAWGLADLTINTTNIWYKNWMYANRVDKDMNSSYIVNFDNALSSGQTLPVKTIYPGAIDTLANVLSLDNIIIRFSTEMQDKYAVGDLMPNMWISNNVIV